MSQLVVQQIRMRKDSVEGRGSRRSIFAMYTYTWLGSQTSSRLSLELFRGRPCQGVVGSRGRSPPAAEEAALTCGASTLNLTQRIQPDFAMRSSRWQCRQTNRSECQFKNTELRTSKVQITNVVILIVFNLKCPSFWQDCQIYINENWEENKRDKFDLCNPINIISYFIDQKMRYF